MFGGNSMKRSKKNIERNKLDYLLTDIMPVEVSELFSFSKFYEYLLSKQSTLDDIVSKMRAMKAENSETPFAGGKWGNWATSPLKFNILKGTDSIRGLNLVQPLSAMNIYFFVECYQKELLDILSNNSCFSLRYHRKNSDLFYRRKSKKIVDYFEKTSQKVDRAILQQTGAYFKIYKFNSVSSFTNSRLWQQCNFKYHNFAKIDYKSCFDSIYTHAYKWCIEKDTVDSKEASNANLHIVIDRVLQNINGRSSNGLIVGPEFSRMIAEVLLQEIDVEVKQNLAAQGLNAGTDYRVFRYVDDIYIFSHTQAHTDLIIKTIEIAAQKYLLKFNEFKYLKANTPVVLSSWLGKAHGVSNQLYTFVYLHLVEHSESVVADRYVISHRVHIVLCV